MALLGHQLARRLHSACKVLLQKSFSFNSALPHIVLCMQLLDWGWGWCELADGFAA